MIARSIALACLLLPCTIAGAQAQSALPPDPKPTCTVSATELAGWFASGHVTLDGLVNPADSITFSDKNDCDFYKWSSRMFLWLTSPTSASPYGGDGSVFESLIFYDVSPPDANGQRVLIPNTPGVQNPIFPIRVNKPEKAGGTGQAGGEGVLISQGQSLVYYGIAVNDVYAEFLTGQKDGHIQATQFPTTQTELNAIQQFAGKTFADGVALTMEVKTSWVDATTVDEAQYLTMVTQVPTYARTNDLEWTLTGSKTKKLALVGMHVVGSAKGHPEMIWATFEHIGNTPDNTYYYTRADGTQAKVPYNSTGSWLFMATDGPLTGANVEVARVDSKGNIVAEKGHVIAPSNTFGINPWGNAGDSTASAANNTEIIALNSTILPKIDRDVRSNYVLKGAVWTKGGVVPLTNSPPPDRVGSLLLSNTTMETYHQDKNCFGCHYGGALDGLSHVYGSILPLPGK